MSEPEAAGTGSLRVETLDRAILAGLIAWKPPGGLFSVYANVDPGDRSGRRRIELRDDLDRVVGSSGGAEEDRREVETTAKRIEESVAALSQQASGRGIVGFVEVGGSPEEGRWFATQLAPRRTEAHLGSRAKLAPLLALLEDGAPTGVAVISAECVRLFDWRLGQLEQLHDWELEVFSLDWRERKAPGPSNPAGGSGASAAGHDQYRQRLDHNRDGFARETGKRARQEAERREWEQVIAFGDHRHTAPFVDGFGEGTPIHHVDQSDLATQPTHLIAERVDGAIPAVHRERERALVDALKDAGFAGGRASLGPQETLQALEAGRVERLVYDARLDGPEIERMIELAATSSASVVPVEGAAAAALSEQDGVAALLRY